MEIGRIYDLLFAEMGDLGWWPAESADEVVIGAILTQNTNWNNVEKALAELRKAGLLSLESLSRVETGELSSLIRSSGFHNQKAARLKDLSSRIVSGYGSLERMSLNDTLELVDFLRPIKGVGQETLDSILLYALDKPVFVLDNYSTRIFSRAGFSVLENDIRKHVAEELSHDVERLKNFHAMLVQLAKNHCRKKPSCKGCPLSASCKYYREFMFP